MHVDTMKNARVSSVYEGKERNRYSSKGEELTRRDHSRNARLTAKARMKVHKESMRSLSKLKKPMVMMRSMRKNEERQEDHRNVIARVVEKEKDKNDEGVIMEKMDAKTEMHLSGWVEEWPQTLTYEEEWTWFAFAFGWGRWWRYDAVMSGGRLFN
ncbi:unnamed protein product [Microthlaspi erraticum]|uniref:Uncharacterized protein n=1 Tax=Microthlaspi erraticum TaxID=1685480 RepID=A0A6D2KU82_9BRAS|nr:unnamed protein product [Microthlaspi erraticum]